MEPFFDRKIIIMTHYVLDTSTLIYDPKVVFKYPHDDFIIPYTVIRELDSIKVLNNHKGAQAREVFRILDELRKESGKNLHEGVPNAQGSTIRIELNHVNTDNPLLFPPEFHAMKNDDIIINVVRNLCIEDVIHSNDHFSQIVRDVSTGDIHNEESLCDFTQNLSKRIQQCDICLMTQDISMSIKAEILDVKTQRHTVSDDSFILGAGVVYADVDRQYYTFDGEEPQFIIQDLYDNKSVHIDDYKELHIDDDLPVNTGVVIRDGNSTALSVSDGEGNLSLVPQDFSVGYFTPKGAEQKIALHMMCNKVHKNFYKNNDGNEFIASLSGRAGSGKTTLALVSAIQGVKEGKYSKIIVFRPTVNMSKNSDLGYLPGTLEEKMSPWVDAIRDVLRTLGYEKENDMAQSTINGKDIEDIIDIQPVNYLRGRTFNNTFIIVDEAQNLEPHELYTIVTRLGYGTSMVMTWDAMQVDNSFIKNHHAEAPLSVLQKVMPDERVFHIDLPNNERGGLSAMFT